MKQSSISQVKELTYRQFNSELVVREGGASLSLESAAQTSNVCPVLGSQERGGVSRRSCCALKGVLRI
jgi:hypothetical protein